MEAVEETLQTNVGFKEIRSTRMDGEKVSRLWESLSSGFQNNRASSYQQRNPRTARTSELLGLLLGLNRRMPNGTHGGVRGATG